jgi:hypothetical protein
MLRVVFWTRLWPRARLLLSGVLRTLGRVVSARNSVFDFATDAMNGFVQLVEDE